MADNQSSRKRIRQSPKLPAGERREQLLKAAQELFLKYGYQATSIEEIARSAGVTKNPIVSGRDFVFGKAQISQAR